MFCPKCGAENTDDACFCCKCGSSLPIEAANPSISPVSRFAANSVPAQEAEIVTQRKPKILLIAGIVLFLTLIAVAVVFFIRSSNESNLLSSVTSTISDSSGEDIEAYYDQFLPVPYAEGGYMQGCHYDRFRLENGNDGNTFLVTGLLTVTDLSLEERPSYEIGISGTVITNFFRTEYKVSWNYDFEEPEIQLPDVNLDWIEGTYHQVHYYPMEMDLKIYEDVENPRISAIYYTFTNGDEFCGDGVVYYVGGEDMPRFEGEAYGSSISIEYNGWNFVVNCPSLGFEEIEFFED